MMLFFKSTKVTDKSTKVTDKSTYRFDKVFWQVMAVTSHHRILWITGINTLHISPSRYKHGVQIGPLHAHYIMFLAQTHSNTDAQTNLYDKKSSESCSRKLGNGKGSSLSPFLYHDLYSIEYLYHYVYLTLQICTYFISVPGF